jgi:hypothetical protein
MEGDINTGYTGVNEMKRNVRLSNIEELLEQKAGHMVFVQSGIETFVDSVH